MRKQKASQAVILPSHFNLVACDFSLRRPGFCVMEVTRDPMQTLPPKISFRVSSVDNKKENKCHGQMLDEIGKGFTDIIPEDDTPLFFVREKAISGKGSMAETGIYEVVGLTNWIIYRLGYEWHEIYPVTVKKLITGSGKADKAQVAAGLINYLDGLDDHKAFQNDDESDATAVAIAFLIQNGVLSTAPTQQPNLQPAPEVPIQV